MDRRFLGHPVLPPARLHAGLHHRARLDSLQLTDGYRVATPVNWKQGDDVIIVPAVTDDEAKTKFPRAGRRSSPTCASPRSPSNRHVEGRRVLVIGAGCVGANVAYRLAERGATVTVLDAGSPGGGTSGASFAWTNSFSKTPRDYHDLNVAGMEEHAALSKELGGGWLHQDDAIAWEETPAGLARLDQAVERLAGWGYPVERISLGHARELEPDLQIGDAVPHVVWTPGEGYVEA